MYVMYVYIYVFVCIHTHTSVYIDIYKEMICVYIGK